VLSSNNGQYPAHRGRLERTPMVKNTIKIRANTSGILAVNGTSTITFRERSAAQTRETADRRAG